MATPLTHTIARAEALAQFYNALGPQDLPRLGDWYHAQVHFVDPFNDVRGLPALRRIFEHMFEQLDEPRFEILTVVAEHDRAWLSWDFHFRRRGQAQPWRIHGATSVRFDAQGLVLEHLDYWDAAAQLYERLPVIGAVLRWLRQRLAVA